MTKRRSVHAHLLLAQSRQKVVVTVRQKYVTAKTSPARAQSRQKVFAMVEKMCVVEKRRQFHVHLLLAQNRQKVVATVREKSVVEKLSPARVVRLAQNSLVLSRLILVAKSRLAILSVALVLLTKQGETSFYLATATLGRSHSNRKKIRAATKHLVMLPRWTRLHVEAVVPVTKPHRVSQLILREEPPLTAVKRRVEMTAAVHVSRHAAARIRTVTDHPVQLVQARCVLAAILEALVVRPNCPT